MQKPRVRWVACACGVLLAAACAGPRARPLVMHGVPQDTPGLLTPLPTHIEGSPVRGAVHLLVGRRETNDALGRAGVHQGVLRIEGEVAPTDFPIGVEVGISGASGSGDDAVTLTSSSLYDSFESQTNEIWLGPRFTWSTERAGLYLGAGSVWTDVSAESGSLSFLSAYKVRESGSDHGLYAHFGAYGVVAPYCVILFEVRYAFDQHVELFGERDDVGYWEVDLGFGVRL